MLRHLADPGDTAPLRVSQSLERGSQQWACNSNTNQPIQSPHSYDLLYQALTLRATVHQPWSPQSQVADNQEQPLCPRALKLFKLANPKRAHSASLVSSWENHFKGFCPHSLPPSLCFLTNPSAFFLCGPVWHGVSLPLRIWSRTSCLFSGGCFLIWWP